MRAQAWPAAPDALLANPLSWGPIQTETIAPLFSPQDNRRLAAADGRCWGPGGRHAGRWRRHAGCDARSAGGDAAAGQGKAAIHPQSSCRMLATLQLRTANLTVTA